jgi:hypothetical protein
MTDHIDPARVTPTGPGHVTGVQPEELTETSERLHQALAVAVGQALDREPVYVEAYHTGGGCMVAAVDLSIDGRMIGRQLWLTREDGWIVGFYDFAAEKGSEHSDKEDEGVCVKLLLADRQLDDPHAVAGQVAAILVRLGVTNLQGE